MPPEDRRALVGKHRDFGGVPLSRSCREGPSFPLRDTMCAVSAAFAISPPTRALYDLRAARALLSSSD
eukprot:CAMPEP_0173383760 /NCGR_PEP_ID=MMETSP1356-20130122/6341_1 /TAXON_ID=77927 ORGANISM="Hemiselmis virescens, Strain PCC157" /NCGR_SAMPLE_ID=MMETSP1356 /ASSEMBLY_ACC=CAM_ASM_000847 /LENGTH=67 /DNA_ID=CAMNT_0014338781 /DNA_START=79 /DNA_END=279 /DNA_ORIENTATION=-